MAVLQIRASAPPTISRRPPSSAPNPASTTPTSSITSSRWRSAMTARRRRRSHGFQAHVGPMRSKSRGSVTLRSADPKAKPVIRFNYMSHPDDWSEFRHSIRLTREIFGQKAFDPYRGREISPGANVESDDELDAYIRDHAESAYHPCGTCRMGRADDVMSVVDPECRVIGVDGLARRRFLDLPAGDQRQPQRAVDHDRREGRRPHPRQGAAGAVQPGAVDQPALAGVGPVRRGILRRAHACCIRKNNVGTAGDPHESPAEGLALHQRPLRRRRPGRRACRHLSRDRRDDRQCCAARPPTSSSWQWNPRARRSRPGLGSSPSSAAASCAAPPTSCAPGTPSSRGWRRSTPARRSRRRWWPTRCRPPMRSNFWAARSPPSMATTSISAARSPIRAASRSASASASAPGTTRSRSPAGNRRRRSPWATPWCSSRPRTRRFRRWRSPRSTPRPACRTGCSTSSRVLATSAPRWSRILPSPRFR